MKNIFRIIAILLVFAMVAPSVMATTVDPRTSLYIQTYSVYLDSMTNSDKFTINYRVYATGFMAEVGVTQIVLQESANGTSGWTDVATYSYTDNKYKSLMMANNKLYLNSSVPYTEGIDGYYYRALITVWAGDGTNGDSRHAYTAVKQYNPS